MLGDTLSRKSLAYTFKATNITYVVVLKAIDRLLQGKTKEKTGQQSVKDLRKKGSLEVVDISEQNLKNLKRYLKKFGMDYSILKNKTKDNQYTLFFRTYDSEILNKVMSDYLQKQYKEKKSIKEKINIIRQKSINKTREKPKNKTRKRKEIIEL